MCILHKNYKHLETLRTALGSMLYSCIVAPPPSLPLFLQVLFNFGVKAHIALVSFIKIYDLLNVRSKLYPTNNASILS